MAVTFLASQSQRWPFVLWRHRWLFLNFYQREIKSRYVGSVTGIFWALLNPLIMLAVYAVVFQYIFGARAPEGLGEHGFVAFVAMGLWPWLAFQEGWQRGTLALQNGAGLIKKIAFPHELLVYAAVAATFTVHGAGFLLVMAVLSAWLGVVVWTALPWMVALFVLLAVLTMALALLTSALQTLFRDVEHFLSPITMVLMYATPVLYGESMVPKAVSSYLSWNPLSPIIDGMRTAALHGQWATDSRMLWVALFTLALFASARWFFGRLSPYFEDFL